MKPVLVPTLAALSLGGCVTHETGASGRYFGFVRVEGSRADAPVENTRMLILGLWADPPSLAGPAAVGLGLRKLQRLTVPADCRLVVSVATDAQLAQVRDLIAQSAAQGGACAIKS